MTFTKEWLQKAISDIETMRDEIPFGLDEDGNNTLQALKMALAGLESEPVADVVAWSHPTEERTCDIRWRRHDVSPGPLYTAPQPLTTSERAELENYRNAQQVVPDGKAVQALTTEIMELVDRITGYRLSVAKMSELRPCILEACRAAMLQGYVENDCGK